MSLYTQTSKQNAWLNNHFCPWQTNIHNILFFYSKMSKSKDYAPYLFSFVMTAASVVTQNLAYQEGLALRCLVFGLALLGMWRWIEWLLTRTENKFVQWVSVLVGINVYNLIYLNLDYRVLHLIPYLTEEKLWNLNTSLFLIGVVATIFIESIKWTKARKKAQLDNLNLQSENIEAKFQLLKEQVNPDFLFGCLTTLRTMVRTDDPHTEDYILKLADVYRQTLKTDKSVVSLREELALLQTYMHLICYGREAAVSFEVNVSDASLNRKLPIFALQLLGDNCVKHNEFSENQPLQIRIFQKDPQSVTMTNNYQQRENPKSFGLDIEHLEMRYAFEGVENGVFIEKEATTYSTTLKLF